MTLAPTAHDLVIGRWIEYARRLEVCLKNLRDVAADIETRGEDARRIDKAIAQADDLLIAARGAHAETPAGTGEPNG